MDKAMSRITIVQDTREKTPWRFRKTAWCNSSEIATVKTGDYTIKEIPNLITIERKAGPAELCMNFTNKDYRRRIFAEMERMQEYKYKFIIVECTLEEVMTAASYKYIRGKRKHTIPAIVLGTLNAIQLKYGVHVIFAGDKGREFAANLFRKAFEYYMKEQAEDEARRYAQDSDSEDCGPKGRGAKDKTKPTKSD